MTVILYRGRGGGGEIRKIIREGAVFPQLIINLVIRDDPETKRSECSTPAVAGGGKLDQLSCG